MFFRYSVASSHPTAKPSWGWLRVGVRKPRLVLAEIRATWNKVTATPPRSHVREGAAEGALAWPSHTHTLGGIMAASVSGGQRHKRQIPQTRHARSESTSGKLIFKQRPLKKKKMEARRALRCLRYKSVPMHRIAYNAKRLPVMSSIMENCVGSDGHEEANWISR